MRDRTTMEQKKSIYLQDDPALEVKNMHDVLICEYKNFKLSQLANKIKAQINYRPKPKIYYC